METIKKFNRQEFDKTTDKIEFNNFLSECATSMVGKDGYYTRNDAFKSGVTIAYSLLKPKATKTVLGAYLGECVICPNSKDILVECYGSSYPAQRETLEQEGFNAYVELETVIHEGTDITDYLCDNDIEKLTNKVKHLIGK